MLTLRMLLLSGYLLWMLMLPILFSVNSGYILICGRFFVNTLLVIVNVAVSVNDMRTCFSCEYLKAWFYLFVNAYLWKLLVPGQFSCECLFMNTSYSRVLICGHLNCEYLNCECFKCEHHAYLLQSWILKKHDLLICEYLIVNTSCSWVTYSR